MPDVMLIYRPNGQRLLEGPLNSEGIIDEAETGLIRPKT